MAGITTSLSNLLSSILDLIKSFLNTILAVFQSALAVPVSALQSVFELVKGLAGFILGTLPSYFYMYTCIHHTESSFFWKKIGIGPFLCMCTEYLTNAGVRTYNRKFRTHRPSSSGFRGIHCVPAAPRSPRHNW